MPLKYSPSKSTPHAGETLLRDLYFLRFQTLADMRGADTFNESLVTLSHLEDFIAADHPLRSIRAMVNEALVKMTPMLTRMYAADFKGGRPSIAPEKLLRVMLPQVFYSVRSERQLMEQTRYNLLFAGLSAWPWTTACGCPPCLRRTVNA